MIKFVRQIIQLIPMVIFFNFKKYFQVIFLIFCLVVTSCRQDEYANKIDEAELLIEVDDSPGAALTILKTMSYDSIKSESDKARYGYLYSRAKHKMYQRLDSDLYIKQTVDFYQTKGDSRELMRSLFYYSNYLYDRGAKESAVRAVMKSRGLAIKFRDDYWRAKTAELLACILSSGHNYQDAIKYNIEAIEYYCKEGCILNSLYSNIDLARCYGNILQFDRCLAITDSVLEIAKNECDSSLMSFCYKTQLEYYIDSKEYSKAEKALDGLLDATEYPLITQRDLAYKAKIFSKTNNIDSALVLLGNLQKQDLSKKSRGVILHVYRDIYKDAGDYKNAYKYSDSLLTLVDDLSRISHSQLLVAAQRDYLDEGLRFAEMKSKEQRKLLVLVGVIAFFIVLFIVLFYQYRLKVKRLESERKINDIMLVFNDINHKNHELEVTVKNQEQTLTDMGVQIESVDELRMRLRELYRNQWTLLNSLCYEYFEKRDSDKFRSYMFNRIESELQKFKGQLSNKQITESTDRYLDGLASKFIEQCGFLNDVEQRFVLMVFAGFSPRAICLFMGFKQKNFYAKKKQIMMKVSESDAPDRDLFLRYLE
ncbi:MAG: hypothetical protein K2H59_08330 [Muribaculaceae bacterium]|nr:hypothetical protein [Muribaculaceae bacterium]